MQIDEFLDLVKRRRSIRRFKTAQVPDEYIEKILEAGRWAMSGANGQPWEFIVVKGEETRGKIADLLVQSSQRSRFFEMSRIEELRHGVTAVPPEVLEKYWNAPVYIVVCGDPRTFQATVLVAQYDAGEGYITFHHNIANATMLIHLAAAALGLGSRWVSISYMWEEKLKALLGIPDMLRVNQIVAVGYPAYKPGPGNRRELNEMVHYEKYDMSKFRSDSDIIEFLAKLRGKMKPAYTEYAQVRASGR